MIDDHTQTVAAICACGQAYELGPEYFGMIAECSACGADMEVPEADEITFGDVELFDHNCEYCGVELEIPTAWQGHAFPCPGCGEEITAEDPTEPTNGISDDPTPAIASISPDERQEPSAETDAIPIVPPMKDTPLPSVEPVQPIAAIQTIDDISEADPEPPAEPVVPVSPVEEEAVTETPQPALTDEALETDNEPAKAEKEIPATPVIPALAVDESLAAPQEQLASSNAPSQTADNLQAAPEVSQPSNPDITGSGPAMPPPVRKSAIKKRKGKKPTAAKATKAKAALVKPVAAQAISAKATPAKAADVQATDAKVTPVKATNAAAADAKATPTKPASASAQRAPKVTIKKNRRPFRALSWLAGLIILGAAGVAIYFGIQIFQEKRMASGQTDKSLSVEEYQMAGLPPHDRKWTPDDYRKAVPVFQELSRQSPEHLPIYQSGKSGKVFDRLIAPENLAFIHDRNRELKSRIEEGFILRQSITQIINSYRSDTGNYPVFEEQIKLMFFAIDMHQRVIQLIDVEAQPLFTRDPQFMATSLNAKKAHRNTQLQYSIDLMNLAAHKDVPLGLHQDIMEQMLKVMPPIIQNLEGDELTNMKSNFEDAAASIQDNAIRTDVNELINTLF